MSRACREKVYAANRKYSAVHGEDLFKMTTESSAGLMAIGEPCRDGLRYGQLIDALYFLIYEGTGACKRLPDPVPEFSMDVKFVRTALRHDIDHGSETEIQKKRLRASAVFETYSGKKSPEECGPEEFLSAQFRILRALRTFLDGL